MTISEVLEVLSKPTASEATKKLAADNSYLKPNCVSWLDSAAIRAELRRTQIWELTSTLPPISDLQGTEKLQWSIIEAVGTMINAWFKGLEDRLLSEKRPRPLLATDTTKAWNVTKPTAELAPQLFAPKSGSSIPYIRLMTFSEYQLWCRGGIRVSH